MKITRDDAVALCVALGFKTAKGWNKQRMTRKLEELSGLANDGGIEVEADYEDAERLNELLSRIAAAEDVDVVKELTEEELGIGVDEEAAEDVEDEVEPELVKPKRGRPRKVQEEVEEKPTAKKRGRPPKTEEPAVEKKTIRTLNRSAALGSLMLTQKGRRPMEEIAVAADAMVVKSGGKSNLREANYRLGVIVPALEEMGIVSKDGKYVIFN